MFTKSNYQSKPRAQSLTRDNYDELRTLVKCHSMYQTHSRNETRPSHKEMKAQMGSLNFQMDINLEKMEVCL